MSLRQSPRRRLWLTVGVGLLALAVALWFADPDYPGLTEASQSARLLDLEEPELTALLGPPDRTSQFTMAECCTEFQGGLLNHLPPPGVRPADAVVHQFTWKRLRYSLTVWTYRDDEGRQWRAVESLAVGRLAPSF